MTNLIEEALSWFEGKRAGRVGGKTLVETVVVKTATKERTVRATVLEPESLVNGQELKVRTDKFIFLIKSTYLEGLDIKRGIRFFRKGRMYEAIIDAKTLDDFNDPNLITKSIAAQLRPYETT
jgi:hypothetical protein